MGTETESKYKALFQSVADRAKESGVFENVELKRDGSETLVCSALNSAEPADYRVQVSDGTIWVSLSMKDRWQSESIESELLHSGDKLNELIEDELDDLGIADPIATFEHFRSPELEFVFRSRVPAEDGGAPSPELVGTWLLAYEQCFRQLGDMDETEED